ncbi:MAG TPA: HRDC domain-containing protein [Nitriliruptorales bacterium]|nr:HRDC domain-containing protein [Nitriliruptorales bacterium]
MEIVLVEQADAVTEALAGLVTPVVGVDVERADGQRYFREAALVQVGAGERCVILDPLALGDLGALADFLSTRLAVLHAVENDLEPLAAAGVPLATPGTVHERVADTAAAATVLGLPSGLVPLLREVLGVTLPADKERFQRADWSVRPLDGEMLAYAAGDVVYLPSLWEALRERLDRSGRHPWYEQELQSTLDRASADSRSWARTKGIGRLDGHGRAVLRAVWEEREAISRGEDVAPQRVARDEVLVAIAKQPRPTLNVLGRRGLRRQQIERYGQRLLAAASRGASGPDEPNPSGLRRSTDEDRDAYDRMRRARLTLAEELGLDPGVLCAGRALWAAVLSDPDSPEELASAAGLRPWQRELLEDRLWAAYRGA